jgi:hypothetical protein
MSANIEAVKLQLAMAFGQGTGVMLAETEALDTLLAEESEVLRSAMTSNWEANRWAFTELVRTLGQVSAVHAAVDGSATIRWKHVQKALPAVMVICPCSVRRPVPQAGR